jgi:hypothetical protein
MARDSVSLPLVHHFRKRYPTSISPHFSARELRLTHRPYTMDHTTFFFQSKKGRLERLIVAILVGCGHNSAYLLRAAHEKFR